MLSVTSVPNKTVQIFQQILLYLWPVFIETDPAMAIICEVIIQFFFLVNLPISFTQSSEVLSQLVKQLLHEC